MTKIDAVDIQDAWFQCIAAILNDGFKYEVEQGSFVGQTRLEFDHIVVHIKFPYSEPYDTMLPHIPPHLNIPNPVANGYVEQYLPYLMTDHIEPTEQYTYGSRIAPQIPHWVDMLQKTPRTNQAVLQVARHDDYKLEDPPCLRHIDMRIKENTLIFYPYFRSWDLWGGFPANLAGIAVLQKTMADEIGVASGPIVASSKGLHIYGYVEELARIRTGK
ncbi:MAG: thymidylate synthase [Thermodesulfobacteriota bacterium]